MNTDPHSDPARANGPSDATVLIVGVLMLVLLLPLVLGTVGYSWTAFVVAGLLLALATFVKPEGNAASLRYIPAGLGVFALLGGIVALFR